jgi:hypothetical protein
MEWLQPVAEDEAVAFHRAIALRTPRVAELVDIVRRIHERARRELPWCGPLDHKPANVMRATDGRLVVADLFYADGPNLYATAATDPDLIVAKISQAERRFMTEIPLATSGPREPGAQEAMRVGLAAADACKARAQPCLASSECAFSAAEQCVDPVPVRRIKGVPRALKP